MAKSEPVVVGVVEDYELLGTPIAHEGPSIFYKARHIKTQKLYLLEEFETDDPKVEREEAKARRRQIQNASVLNRNKNILQFYDQFPDDEGDRIYVVHEFPDRGNLEQFMKRIRKGKVFDEEELRGFVSQMANGLRAMWESKMVHRGIKPMNIKVVASEQEGQFVYKLGGLKGSKIVPETSVSMTRVGGSEEYMAPELAKAYDKASLQYERNIDLFSLGAVCCYLLTMKKPWSRSELMKFTPEELELRVNSLTESLSDTLQGLLRKMLKYDPNDRITFEEFFNHPFLSHGPENPCFEVKDTATGKSFLVDTGAEISVDPVNEQATESGRRCLIAANGSTIKTYGKRNMTLNLEIGTFPWEFEVADVDEPILGADFFKHHGIVINVREQRLQK